MRVALYREASDLAAGASWRYQHANHPHELGFFCSGGSRRQRDSPAPWYGADERDCDGARACDLYHLEAIAYESILVGQLAILNASEIDGICKSTELHVAFSRDGVHWSRADSDLPEPPSVSDGGTLRPATRARQPLIGTSVLGRYRQPIAGNVLVVGDELFVYYGGVRTAVHSCPQSKSAPARVMSCCDAQRGALSEETALAVLRRDGFASLTSPTSSAEAVTVVTRPLRFSRGAFLFVNADATHGELRVAVERVGGRGAPPNARTLSPFTTEACVPLRHVNRTKIQVFWRGTRADELRQLEGAPFRLTFVLRRASLFSFWVTMSPDGHSGGFVAGGGPGFTNGRDSIREVGR